MMKPLFSKSILLGSKSPRRSFLMKESGFDVEVKTIEVDESFPEEMDKREIAEYISNKKADAYLDLLAKDQIGLVADTIVYFEGEVLEKPINRDDAINMLTKMSGKKHTVFTGVTIFDSDRTKSFTGVSDVYFLSMTGEEIAFYVDKYRPFDKAGSYGIQEWIGYTKIEKIEGSYSNIMGLPMEMVYQELFDFINPNKLK